MSKTKDQIDSVIQRYGTDVTHRTITFDGTYDAFGEPQTSSTSDATVKAVKDNNLIKQVTLTSAGRVVDGSSSLIVKADVTVDPRTSKFVFGGQTYNVLEVEALELSGESLAQIILIGLDNSN